MYESSGSQFVRTTAGIILVPDLFDKSRFAMTLLTILGVSSFKLRKIGKEIPESSQVEFLEKFLANNFASSDAEGNTPGPLDR